MPKTTSLLDRLAKEPDMRGGRRTWYERLEEAQPAFYADVCDLLQKFDAGDEEVRKKLPNLRALVAWLGPLLREHGSTGSSQTAINQLLEMLRAKAK